ncbi:MAG: type II secretion system protein GspL [Pseudomonadota bacterium]|nr:type II secretion system protein GspL [Pseudomonadota bacterium]
MLLRCLESGEFVACEASRNSESLSAAEMAARLRGTPTAGNTQELHLLLPAARCLVTTVPVAAHESKHLAKTLPWSLEERLLEPVEQVHVAHGAAGNGSAPVSAVNAAWLQLRIDDLHAAGLHPQSACSELLLLPWEEGQWTVAVPANADAAAIALVRHGAHAGFACSQANLATALQLLLNEQDAAPRQVLVITDAPDAIDASRFPVLLQSRLAVRKQNLAQLATNASLPACNLLQGRFAPPLPWTRWWREWRVAAVLLAGLLIADLAMSAYDIARLGRAASTNEEAILALYRSVQPDGLVVDPRLQLEQALAAVGAAGQEGFLALLGRMAPALQATPAARVQNLEYDSNSGDLQLQVLTNDYAAAESLRAQLQRLGLQAELLGSSRDTNGNRTRLRVRGGV